MFLFFLRMLPSLFQTYADPNQNHIQNIFCIVIHIHIIKTEQYGGMGQWIPSSVMILTNDEDVV